MIFKRTRLPIGSTSFKDIILDNKIYVDKTDLIASFACTNSFYFLSRPRRFGKSTLVDTLHELFSNGLTNFKDLKIVKNNLWHDTTYKVLHLDFSSLPATSDIDLFNKILINNIEVQCKILKLQQSNRQYANNIVSECLKSYLDLLVDEKIVLLIDEYDAPLTANLDNKENFNKIKEILSYFYSTIKEYNKKFRFVFITGITRYANASMFTGLNNLIDISFKSEYSALLGYTQEELEYYFKNFIKNAADVLNKENNTTEYTYDVIAQKLKENYFGYSFDTKAKTHVYNPWSILNFLSEPELGFENYWTDTVAGTPTLLVKYLKSWDANTNQEVLNNYINLDFTTPSSISNLTPTLKDISDEDFSFEAILYQAGYLSIKKKSGKFFSIGIPNFEIRKTYSSIILESLLNKDITKIRAEYKKILIKALSDKDLEKLKDSLNKYLNEFSYNFYKDADEIRYREVVRILLTLLSISTYSEVETSKGRCDLRLSYQDKLYVIEFKLVHSESDVGVKLNEAIEQIKDRKSDKILSNQTIVPLAMVLLDKKATNDKAAVHEIVKILEIQE